MKIKVKKTRVKPRKIINENLWESSIIQPFGTLHLYTFFTCFQLRTCNTHDTCLNKNDPIPLRITSPNIS